MLVPELLLDDELLFCAPLDDAEEALAGPGLPPELQAINRLQQLIKATVFAILVTIVPSLLRS